MTALTDADVASLMENERSKAIDRLGDCCGLVESQANDITLWFPVGALGSQLERLQLALRRLHGLVEGEPTPWTDR